MKHLAILLCAILAPLFLLRADELPQAYFDLMGKADDAIAANRLDEAESALIEALNIQPGNPLNAMLLSNLGMVRFSMGRDSMALENLNAAHAMAPASQTILRNRVKVLTAMHLYDRALEDCELLIDADSLAVEPLFTRVMISLEQSGPQGAERFIEPLRQAAPDSYEANYASGRIAEATSELSDARRFYTAAIKALPTADAYNHRAICNIYTGQLGEAADDIALGLEIDPDHADLYVARALLNRLRYRDDDARADIKRAIALGTDPTLANYF